MPWPRSAAPTRRWACGSPTSSSTRSAALVQEAWWEGVAVPPATLATLEELRRRGLRLGLCSNAPYRARSLRDQLAPSRAGRALRQRDLLERGRAGASRRRRSSPPPCGALGADGPLDAPWSGIAAARTWPGPGRRGMVTIRVREHSDDPGPDDADAVVDRLPDLIELLFPSQEGDARGSVVGDDTSRRSPTSWQEP